MSEIKIEYGIYPDIPEENTPHDNLFLLGGIKITVRGTVITKYLDDLEDEGFRGDFIIGTIKDLILLVPRFLKGKGRYESFFSDSPGKFVFDVQEDQVRIRVVEYDNPDARVCVWEDGKIIEKTGTYFNRKYPDYPDGKPVRKTDLVLEIIRIGEEFIEYLQSEIPLPDEEMARLTGALEQARKSASDFIRN